MPLYEYQCQNCGEIVEVIQRFSDLAPASCGACGGQLVRLMSAPAIQFKGTGWYITDYARKSANSTNGDTSKGSSTEKSGTSESKTSAGEAKSKSAATD